MNRLRHSEEIAVCVEQDRKPTVNVLDLKAFSQRCNYFRVIGTALKATVTEHGQP